MTDGNTPWRTEPAFRLHELTRALTARSAPDEVDDPAASLRVLAAWHELVDPVADERLREAWHACADPGTLYQVGAPGSNRVAVVRMMIAVGTLALGQLPQEAKAPQLALEAARAWCEGLVTIERVSQAFDALELEQRALRCTNEVYAAYTACAGAAAVALARGSAPAPLRGVQFVACVPLAAGCDILRQHLSCPSFSVLERRWGGP